MKLRIDREVFAQAVAWMAGSLPARPSLPVLAGALLSVTADRLTVSSYDYEVSRQADVEAGQSDDGAILVSGRLLTEIAKALPSQPVEVLAETSRAVLTCGGARFTLPTMPVEDYPVLPVLPAEVGSVDAAEFAKAVAQTQVAAGRDDTLPVLTGIQIDSIGDRLFLSATDRYRFVVRELDWQPLRPDLNLQILAPARTLAGTAKALGGMKGRVTLSAAADSTIGMLGLSSGGFRATTRVLDGRLPDLQAQLALNYDSKARVPTAALNEVVKRMSLVATRDSRLRLSIESDQIRVEAGGAEDAEATETIECRYDGEPLRLAFNTTYLRDGLAACGAPTTVLATDPKRQRVLLTGESADGDTAGFGSMRYMLVPLHWTGV